MDRLELIFQLNPQWGSAIAEFVAENPEFSPHLKYASLTTKPKLPSSLVTIKDLLRYYACFSGVNPSYGKQVFEWVKNNQLDKLTAKKRQIIEEIDKLADIETKEELEEVKIKGIGEGTRTFVLEHYFNDTNIIYPTDRVFQRGLAMIYGLDKVTVANAKTIANAWKGQKSVGSMFCFQVANYGSKISHPIKKDIQTKIPIKLKSQASDT